MKILLATVSVKRSASGGAFAQPLQGYLERSGRYAPCGHRGFGSESALLEFVQAAVGRTRPLLLLLADRSGQQVSSEELASIVGRAQEDGVQMLIFAIGPADGWSATALAAAGRRIAFGRITLPHELAAVVAAEQIYRALTILAGHPYHCGH
jgi:23S rRNA (pseudouridine1915-N3)-methyltransferase